MAKPPEKVINIPGYRVNHPQTQHLRVFANANSAGLFLPEQTQGRREGGEAVGKHKALWA